MNFRELCQKGARIYFDLTFSERVLARHCQNQALLYPKSAMIIEVVVSTILGTMKVFTFPLASLIGTILLPAIFLTKCISTRSIMSNLHYFVAWAMSILVTAFIVTAVFCLIMISPEVVFLMIGILGAVGTSATLLNIHRELFSAMLPQSV
ncbi:hypothetical protein BOKEGFJH_00109 [Chlamydia avium]|nr:hypothetical protein BOKEGFJH_00109 [Chlamydia avium]